MSIRERTLGQTGDSYNRERSYAFEIVQQSLALRGIRLLGGDYTLRGQSEGCSESRWQVTTRT